MDEAQARALVEELKSPDENTRLRAANAFLGSSGEHARLAVPALKSLFLGDPNPAVKFLAKKALTALGEDVEAASRTEVLAEADRADERAGIGDARLLWKVARHVLQEEIRTVLQRIPDPGEETVGALSRCIGALGSETVAGPLVQVFLKDQDAQVTTGEVDVPDADSLMMATDLEQVRHLQELKRSGIDPAMAARMGNLTVPEVFAVLVDMLGSRLPLMVRGSLSAMSEIDDPMVVAPLAAHLGALGDELDEEVLATLEAHAARDKERRVQVLEALRPRLTMAGAWRARRWAMRALGSLEDSDSIDTMRTLLEDEDARVREEGIWSLARFDMPPEWLASCVRPLITDDDPAVAAGAAASLLGSSVSGPAEELVERFLAGSVEEKSLLAVALAKADRAEAGSYLERLLRDEDARVQRASRRAVRLIRSPQAAEFLGGLLADEDSEVAAAAMERVGALKQDQYNDLIVIMIDQVTSARLLTATLEALGKMGLPENVPVIGHYLNAEDARVRTAAIEALEKTNAPKATSLVQLSLSDPVPRVRAAAASALWGWGEVRSLDTIRELLAGDPREQVAGIDALTRMILRVRDEDQLVDHPLLMAALRQAPRYQVLRAAATSSGIS